MGEQPKVAKVLVYRDAAGEFRWSARATNGEPVADSGEGYVAHADALAAAGSLFPDAEVEVEENPGGA